MENRRKKKGKRNSKNRGDQIDGGIIYSFFRVFICLFSSDCVGLWQDLGLIYRPKELKASFAWAKAFSSLA